MGSSLYKPQPITTDEINRIGPEQIGDDILGVPEDVEKLREDAINVLEGRIEINSFSKDYQEKIKDYYRFSGTRHSSKYGGRAKMIRQTLDLV